MARKKTTRPKLGTIYVNLSPYWRRDSARPHYRGTLKTEQGTFDISLWVDEYVPHTPVPLTLSGELSEQKDG